MFGGESIGVRLKCGHGILLSSELSSKDVDAARSRISMIRNSVLLEASDSRPFNLFLKFANCLHRNNGCSSPSIFGMDTAGASTTSLKNEQDFLRVFHGSGIEKMGDNLRSVDLLYHHN